MFGKGINPSYNAQLAVDAKNLMVVGGYVTTSCCDSSQLVPVVADIEKRTGAVPNTLLADRGYSNLQGLAEIESQHIDAYVSVVDFHKHRPRAGFRYEPETDTYRCPENRVLRRYQEHPPGKAVRYRSVSCDGCPQIASCMPTRSSENSRRTLSVNLVHQAADRIKCKMTTPIGIAMRKLRAATVEPVIGVIKHAHRFRQVTVRGSLMVNSAWQFQLAVYNIFKLATFFQKSNCIAHT